MNDRMDAVTPRERNGKTYYVRIGAAFASKNGGYQVVLDALPVPDKDGRCVILLFPPRRDGGHTGDGAIPF